MKKSMLLIGLISLAINSTFSQQYKYLDPNVRNWTYLKQIDSNIIKSFDYNMLRENMQNFPNDNHYIQKWEKFERTIGDNMTILMPRGNYPSLIIKPDTTIRYTLLIKKP